MFPKVKLPKQPIYLDYAATTPVDPEVVKAMLPYLNKNFGNPSALYKQGLKAREAVESSRKSIAGLIGARSEEVIFTAGGTESCNLAILGVARKINTAFRTDKHRPRPHIITTAIEHHAVLNPVKALEGEGWQITMLDVDKNGLINIGELAKAIRVETVLVSVMYANNEIGTVEPIREIGKALARINAERSRKGLPPVIFHTDACQAAGFLDLDVNRLNVDLMSVNGSKIYGPKQVGFLYVRSGIQLKPVIFGGGQERDLRSGTENVPGIVGLAKALEISQEEKLRNKEIKKLRVLQEYFIKQVIKIKGIKMNGPLPGGSRLPNNINLTVEGVEGEALTLYLDSYGIAVSTGSACTTGLADPSHVLLAIGRTPQEAKNSIRVTLGKYTSKQHLKYVLKILQPLVIELQKVNNIL